MAIPDRPDPMTERRREWQKNHKSVSTALTLEEDEKFTEFCRSIGICKSAVIRIAVKDYMAKNNFN